MVLEYLPIDMTKAREKGAKFDILDAKLFSFQLFCAIAYLDAQKVVHMDIKPQNIILDLENGVLKLADFGNARRLDTSEKDGNPYQVTRFYRPPELLFGCGAFTAAIDVWSAGCVAFEFFGNRTLFKGKDTKDQILLITSVLGYPTDEDIKSMGVKRPRVPRKSARGIEKYTSDGFDAEIYDLLKCAILMNPKKRTSGENILKLKVFEVFGGGAKKEVRRTNGKIVPELEKMLLRNHTRIEEINKKKEENESSSKSDE